MLNFRSVLPKARFYKANLAVPKPVSKTMTILNFRGIDSLKLQAAEKLLFPLLDDREVLTNALEAELDISWPVSHPDCTRKAKLLRWQCTFDASGSCCLSLSCACKKSGVQCERMCLSYDVSCTELVVIYYLKYNVIYISLKSPHG
jgi:hypothetical protein